MLAPFLLFYILVPCLADYDCLCTYQVETNIYEHPDYNSNVIGHLYEFDCKPAYNLAWVGQTFQAVGNNHKLGFVEQASQNSMQVCQGSIPSLDRVPPDYLTAPTTTTTTTTTTTVPTTTTTEATTTTSPITTTESTTTMKPTTTITQPTMKMTTPTSTVKLTTTSMPTSKTSTAVPTTKTSSAVPITATQKRTTQPITILPPTTATPQTTKTTTKSPPTTSPTMATTRRPTTSKPTTIVTSRPHTIVTVPTNTVQGNNYLCPSKVKSSTSLDNLYVHDSFCYEFVNRPNTFFEAEFDCPKRGGVMLYIRNQPDQEFIYKMLKDLSHYGPVWLGLHDVNKEEAWEWVSDYPIKYTNWMASRYIANAHDKEDCGIIVAARHGQWDDVHCAGILFSTPATFPWICQYNITRTG